MAVPREVSSTGVDEFYNYDLEEIVTPIDVRKLEALLHSTKYPSEKIHYLVQGFSSGFDIGYKGPMLRKNSAANIPFTVGDKFKMWNKLVKEVKHGRVAGPFREVPFKNSFVQSPIGLVPKAGNKTRLIFHLSYDFNEDFKSINHYIPEENCSVKYKDLDYAVRTCLELLKKHGSVPLYFSKMDVMSAFCLVPVQPDQRFLLLMKAYHPISNQLFYFTEKNLPFGASSSCQIFQSFSDSLKHLVEQITGKSFQVTAYLDDYMFVETSIKACNRLVRKFIEICSEIGCPLSMEKTEWADSKMTFLGILLDGENHLLCVPEDKRQKALTLLKWTIDRKKLTVKQLQSLTGTLNFLCKAILPGRTFVRRMYAKLEGTAEKGLKFFHHISLDAEFISDCRMWEFFLMTPGHRVLCRPFLDINGPFTYCTQIQFYTDASASKKKGGSGCFFSGNWNFGVWPQGFIQRYNPSIEYLELFALTVGILTWSKRLANLRICVYCDNTSVRDMVNASSTSKCKNCMVLLRILVLECMTYNIRLSVRYIETYKNTLANALSLQDFKRFWDKAPRNRAKFLYSIPDSLWPIDKVWVLSNSRK